MSYRVETEAGSEWRRHADQILDSKLNDTKTSDDHIIEPNVAVEYSVLMSFDFPFGRLFGDR
jgi:hypothetical protein